MITSTNDSWTRWWCERSGESDPGNARELGFHGSLSYLCNTKHQQYVTPSYRSMPEYPLRLLKEHLGKFKFQKTSWNLNKLQKHTYVRLPGVQTRCRTTEIPQHGRTVRSCVRWLRSGSHDIGTFSMDFCANKNTVVCCEHRATSKHLHLQDPSPIITPRPLCTSLTLSWSPCALSVCVPPLHYFRPCCLHTAFFLLRGRMQLFNKPS